MSKSALIAKYKALPVTAQKQVEMLIETLSKTASAESKPATDRRFKFDWAGGLEDLKDQFTSIELQHRLPLARFQKI